MKFALADPADGYLIRAYDDQQILIGEQAFRRSLVLLSDRILPDWRPDHFDRLEPRDLDLLIGLEPDLVLLGTGSRQRFPDPSLYRGLIDAGIGLEAMTTAAACRTYNILAGEGRRVAAALLFG
ncbi:MAG TPA: hypothetical protein ENI96_11125 [Sedimenticola thiotaurini]|uniref:Xcc1710-like domain-containing protein n=1 Tax=Sedimenticola thiotaurini TaxID=1543721 RepID=A0A831WB83_9GAMM|nr:hypothetical protein [Sedimenticola thiotaurini]